MENLRIAEERKLCRWVISKQARENLKVEMVDLIREKIKALEDGIEDENDDKLLNIKLKGGCDEPAIPSDLCGFSSEFNLVNTVSNVFRSLGDDWSEFDDHILCSHKERKETGFNCLFCLVRSQSQRASTKKKTRSTLKPIELLSQLGQFRALENFDWTLHEQNDINQMMEKTLSLISKYEEDVSRLFNFLTFSCTKCMKPIKSCDSWTIEVNADRTDPDRLSEVVRLNNEESFKKHSRSCIGCKDEDIIESVSYPKFIFLQYKSPINIRIKEEYNINGTIYNYKCHVRE